MLKFNVFENKVLIKSFVNQENDFEVFRYLLRVQPESVHWALEKGGYKVEYTEDDKTFFDYRYRKVITDPLSLKVNSN